MQPTTNAAAPRLHLLCSRSFFRPRPCEASRHDQLAAAATVCAAMHSARRLLLGQGHAATRGMRTNEDGVAASLPVQSQLLHPSHCHTPGPAHVAVGCSISSAPHAPAPLLYTRTPSACSPAPSPAISSMARLHPCHADATRMQRRPLPLHSPAQHTRRCAAQHRRAGGQGDDGFISENKRNVKRKRVRRRGDIQRDCEARDAS